jgi:hypothetical protein
MTLSEDDLRTLWREHSTSVPSDRSACLTDAEWARLLSKDADTTERVRAAGHIASCVACADEYRLLQPLQSWVADVERVLSSHDASGADRWTTWCAWWSSPRLALAVSAATVLLVTQGVTFSRLVESTRENVQLETQLAENERALSATQISLVAAQEGLRGLTEAQTQLNTLQERLAQLSTPQLDVAIVDLEPQYGGVVRGTSDPQIVTMAPNAPVVRLILNFPPLASRSTLVVEVAEQDGRVRWVGRTHHDQGAATLALALPSEGYPGGEYVIRLFDVTRGRTPLAAYPVVIRHTSGTGR